MTLEDALFLAMHKYGLEAYVEETSIPGLSRLYCDDGQLRGDGGSGERVCIVGMRDHSANTLSRTEYGRGSNWDAAFVAADAYVAAGNPTPKSPGVVAAIAKAGLNKSAPAAQQGGTKPPRL